MSTEKPRERPILFNDQMVRAILEGRKTVTRRAVKDTGFYAIDAAIHGNEVALREREALSTRCPFGQPGDRLWVREAWTIDLLAAYSTEKGYDSEYELRYRADDAAREIHVAPGEPDPYLALYDSQRGDWRPSIHMPRWASRILLEITAVRVERLQDISEEQALAEGVHGEPCDHARQACSDIGCWGDTAKGAFGFLWEQLNGAGAWQAKPWVWVVEFKRVTP
ncbi:hypothetical protein SOJ57_01880 [Pseudomonas aeruginosa]|uniref:hypothetical protein n=1 Tax=Pseudomonas aeruginosa TaxID=287 RepID=UPI00273839E2|nr:hypothetical protein [Pseudomonas aeruginosa]MDY1270406.1 hypothetical protein [Pseudomonas aeruginosa]MDY1463163.1 hypothetical protein [Pseudomonas aeruginosa]HBN8303652.1 hypothetical protein [Pseudomonas aeruginosa]HBN8974987.1 hypothetical protein [Pseudomonas aeruginosa]HCI2329978.1 hypothetical protein [Pseudomonas aeruginosa]